jgi:hypothetical protein
METNAVVEYRGYLLLRRVYSATATDRIRRPDGSWRRSAPTIVDSDWVGWVVGRRSASGAVEELATAASDEEARRWVDARLA